MISLWLWGPVVLQMAVIFIASSIPDLGALPGGVSDKTGHFAGYALLAILLVRAFAGGRMSGITWRGSIAGVLVAVLYGISDEFHQSFVPGRGPDVMDVFADAIGAASGTAFALAARAILAPADSEGRTD